MNILIIDDEIPVRESLREALRGHYDELFEAKDGHEGLWLAEHEKIDLMILDMAMPKVNGLQMYKTLRHNQIKTPVIFLSALTPREQETLAHRDGAILSKPFDLTKLRDMVKYYRNRAHAKEGELIEIPVTRQPSWSYA